MSNGNQHDRNSPPAVMGRRQRPSERNRQIAAKDLHREPPLGLAHVSGVEIDSLGPSTGKIDL